MGCRRLVAIQGEREHDSDFRKDVKSCNILNNCIISVKYNNTQYALLKLIENWKSEVGKRKLVLLSETLLSDFQTSFRFAKLKSYGLDSNTGGAE